MVVVVVVVVDVVVEAFVEASVVVEAVVLAAAPVVVAEVGGFGHRPHVLRHSACIRAGLRTGHHLVWQSFAAVTFKPGC